MKRLNIDSPIAEHNTVTTVFVFAASGISILLGLLNYPVIGHDAYVHLNWLYQFPNIFGQGIAYPRWLPDSFGGFGAPTFYFYPPLVYWLASFFHWIGVGSPATSYNAAARSFAVLSLFTSYILLRQYRAGKLRAFIGACVYSFVAYRFCDIYIRDALTEHAALAFLPLVFLHFKDRFTAMLMMTIVWVALLLTNLPIVYLAVIAVAVVLLNNYSFHEFVQQVVSFLLAIAVAAIYLFPAFALRGLIHQRHLFDLDMHTSQFGFAWLDLFQGHFDWLRILSIGTSIGGFLLLAKFRGKRKQGNLTLVPWYWMIMVALFFQLPFVSAPLWHWIPGMPFVQFSWRWNGIVLLAIVTIVTVERPGLQSSKVPIGDCIFIGLAIVTLVSELTISRNLFNRPPLPINSYFMDAPEYAPKWASSDPSEVIGITLRRMNDGPAVLLGLTLPTDSIALQSRIPPQWTFDANLARPTPVRFHMFYWPYWKAVANNSEVPLSPDPNGFATALLPSGHSIITLSLVTSPIEVLASNVTLVGLVLLGILVITVIYRSITIRRDSTSTPELTRSV